MRIAILGDFHLKENELQWSSQCMDDIRSCEPDLVVPLGDFGSNRLIGSPEGLQQAYGLLQEIGKPVRGILGNHDLQRESGNKGQMHGTMDRELRQLLHLPSAYGVMEYPHYRFIFISTDPQPEESCYQVQECFVSDEQFAWLTRTLGERPGVPVVMFTHAPPIGCGLRTVPYVHVRSTNAYLDQNHDALRWYQLYRETPELILWFSAHYHLSHAYPDSCTNRFGTTFFTTGVHGSATRDYGRVSRIMDMTESGIRVMTLDHSARRLLPEADWVFNGSPAELVESKMKALSLSVNQRAKEDELLYCTAACPVGSVELVGGGIVHLGKDRWLAAGQDGYLWEVSPSIETVWGTLHIGPTVNSISVSGSRIAYAAENKLFWTDARDMWRFARMNPDSRTRDCLEWDEAISSVVHGADGMIRAAAGCCLYEVHEDSLSLTVVRTFSEPIIQICLIGPLLAVHTSCGTVHAAELGHLHEDRWTVLESSVYALDAYGDQYAAIIGENSQCFLIRGNQTKSVRRRTQLDIGLDEAPAAQITCLAGGCALINHGGIVSLYIAGNDRPWKVNAGSKVVAMAAARSEQTNEDMKGFALAVSAEGPHQHPQLQIWHFHEDHAAP